jgi:hypothetical protein
MKLNYLLDHPQTINELKAFKPQYYQNSILINVSTNRIRPIPILLRFLDK